MKLVVMSDTHGKIDIIEQIMMRHKDADAFLHCGDIELPTDYFPRLIVVGGNNDLYFEYPSEKVVTIQQFPILLTHGHQYYALNREEKLALKAKHLGCKMVCFGHTHVFCDTIEQGIHVVNPGSLWRSRDGTGTSYAIIRIENDEITVKRMNSGQ